MPDQLQQQHHQEQTQEIHQIQEQLKVQELKINQLGLKMDQILFQMVGNELDKETGGMIKRVNNLERLMEAEDARLEKRIFSLERTRDRLIVALVVLSFCTGVTFWDLIQKIFNK